MSTGVVELNTGMTLALRLTGKFPASQFERLFDYFVCHISSRIRPWYAASAADQGCARRSAQQGQANRLHGRNWSWVYGPWNDLFFNGFAGADIIGTHKIIASLSFTFGEKTPKPTQHYIAEKGAKIDCVYTSTGQHW